MWQGRNRAQQQEAQPKFPLSTEEGDGSGTQESREPESLILQFALPSVQLNYSSSKGGGAYV